MAAERAPGGGKPRWKPLDPDVPPQTRELTQAIRKLRDRAGSPSFRALSKRSSANEGIVLTLATLSRIFTPDPKSSGRGSLPEWGYYEALFTLLDAESAEYHALWETAQQEWRSCVLSGTLQRAGEPPEPQRGAGSDWLSWLRARGWWVVGGIVAGLSIVVVGAMVVVRGADWGTTALPSVESRDLESKIRDIGNFRAALPRNPTERQLRDSGTRYAQVSPQGPAPWAFIVVADPSLGLKVRTSGLADGSQIGTAAFNAEVWAECRQDTGFNAGEPSGSVWYRIRWPNETPTIEFFNSSPGDSGEGWVYGGLLVPAGHNGDIPDCAQS